MSPTIKMLITVISILLAVLVSVLVGSIYPSAIVIGINAIWIGIDFWKTVILESKINKLKRQLDEAKTIKREKL